MTKHLEQLIKEHFAQVQSECRAPDFAYGVRVGDAVITSNANQQFRIASMTKSFTAAAVLLLRDRGSLQLDTPIEEIIPELRLRPVTSDSPAITVRDLLTMTAGFATDDPWADRQLAISKDEFDALMQDGAYSAAPARTSYVYSNYGYAILGRIITNVSGEPFQSFISSELLEPLGMTSTSWSPLTNVHAKPHRITDNDVIPDEPEALEDGEFAAMGGMWSTVNDLLKWTDFFIDAFPARSDDDKHPLSRASRREMQKLTNYDRSLSSGLFPDGKGPGGYGMGLIAVDDPRSGLLVNHSGGLPGYGSNMTWLPKRHTAVVSLANVTYAPMRTHNLALLAKLEDAGNIPAEAKLEVPLLDVFANLLVGLFNQWDDERANEIFADNVALDESYERRRSALGGLGRLKLRNVTARSAASATAVVIDATSKQLYWLSFSLSSQSVPKVQTYRFSPLKVD